MNVVFQENNFWSWEQEGESTVSNPGYFTVTNSFGDVESNMKTEQDKSTPMQSENVDTPESPAGGSSSVGTWESVTDGTTRKSG